MLRVSYILVFCLISLNSFTLFFYQKKAVRILLFIDDVQENLSKKDKLMLTSKNKTINCPINDSAYVGLPDNLTEKKYNVLFIHNNDSLIFKDVMKESIIPDQNYEWHFGIDNRPFDRSLGLLEYNEYFADSVTRKLIYWQFIPLEFGEGMQTYYKQ